MSDSVSASYTNLSRSVHKTWLKLLKLNHSSRIHYIITCIYYTDGLVALLPPFLGFICGFTFTSAETGLGAPLGFLSPVLGPD